MLTIRNRRQFLAHLSAVSLTGWATHGFGQVVKEPNELPPSVDAYLENLYADQHRQYAYRHDFPGGFAAWQAAARPTLKRLLGLDQISQRASGHSLDVHLGPAQDRGTYSLQQGTLETEPHVRIPFWMLKPKQGGPHGLAILPHGHDRHGHDTSAGVFRDQDHRQRTIDRDGDVAVQAVQRGYLAIAPAVRGLAEKSPAVPDIHGRHGKRDCRSHQMHCLLAGRTAVGERVWDVSKLIDWATKLPEVDASRVLVMGHSGGGVVTIYAAACDERITVAVPSCSFSVIVSRKGRIFHCDCCAIPGILEFGELYDIAGLVAPRFLLAVNGRKDQLHVPEEVDRSAARVRAIYEASGAGDHFEHQWGDQGHRFYQKLMWPFITRVTSPQGSKF